MHTTILDFIIQLIKENENQKKTIEKLERKLDLYDKILDVYKTIIEGNDLIDSGKH